MATTVRWKDKTDITTLAAGDRMPVTDISDGDTDKYTTPAEISTYVEGALSTVYQPLDAELTAVASLTSAADRLPYFTGSGTASLATFTAFARSILDDADEATFKATVNLEIGTDVQAYDADLDTWAGLTPSANFQTLVPQTFAQMRASLDLEAGTDFYSIAGADAAFLSQAEGDAAYQPLDADLTAIAGLSSADSNFIVGSAAGWVVESNATARTSLGLGSLATLSSVNDGNWSGTDLSVANGGTGRSSHTAYAVVCGGTTTTAAQQSIASVGTTGQVLKSNGAGALPTFQDETGGSGITRGTAQATTSGTAFDFTSLPSGLNRITILFDQVSLNGTDNLLIQIGDSGGLEATGYVSVSTTEPGTSVSVTDTTGYAVFAGNASRQLSGQMVLTRIDGNTWTESHTLGTVPLLLVVNGGGSKTLSAELDRVRLTRDGSNTFDNGQINIFYE